MSVQKQNNTLRNSEPNVRNQDGGVFGFLFMLALLTGIVIFGLYVMKLDRTIVSKFEGKRWNIPAKVYSRPLELYQGAPVNAKRLDHWLSLLNYKKVNKNSQITGSYTKQNSTYIIRTRGFNYGYKDNEPSQVIKVSLAKGKISKLETTSPKKGKGILRLEPINIGGIYPDNNEDRMLVNINDVPETLIKALIATEDRKFYEHHGISFRGIGRAVVNNFSGKSMQGGSTLTQQLVKNFYLNSERSLKRKANEAIMALLLEYHYDKNDILQTYINEINLGQSGTRSINGFSLASKFYFNRPLDELTVDQQALLVGMAKGPSLYNPRRNKKNAINRRNTVLNNMLVMNVLSQAEYDEAIKRPLNIVEKPVVGKSIFPDFLDMVKRELNDVYRAEDLKNEGLVIVSTLDPIVQINADRAVDKKVAQLRKYNKHTKTLEAALATANPETGELLAIVGGYGNFTGYNRVLDSKRQVGSLLKPIIYLNALKNGTYNLASAVDDSPIAVDMNNGKQWKPRNYDGKTHENISITDALAKSYNQAAVRVGMEVGVKEVTDTLYRMGIKDDIKQYPSTLLGSNSMSVLQVLNIYQVFATGGFHTPLHSIRSVIDDKGRVLQRSSLKTKASIDPKANYLINHALQQVVKEGTAKKALSLGKHLNLAGKTGTTNNYKDAWFAGYSGNYVSVVWVGSDENKSVKLSGTSGALPIWIEHMKGLNLTPVNLTQPEGIEWLWLENADGRLSNEECMQAKYLPILSKHVPEEGSQCALAIYEAKIEEEQRLLAEKEQAIRAEQEQALAIQQADNTEGVISSERNGEGVPTNQQPVNNDSSNTENKDDTWYSKALEWF